MLQHPDITVSPPASSSGGGSGTGRSAGGGRAAGEFVWGWQSLAGRAGCWDRGAGGTGAPQEQG